MLKEAIQEITGAAVKAAGPQTKEIDPTKTYAVTLPDGTVKFIGNDVPWRNHKAKDLETVAAFADKFTSGAVWVSREKIVFLTDDDDRRQRLTVDMIHSDEIKHLAERQKAKPRQSQRDILFALRTIFTQDALPGFPNLIDALRKVSFEANAKSDSEIQRGKSSVGKAVKAEASFPEPIPEMIVLSVPIFENSFACKRFPVRCAVEIYEAEATIQLFPLPGEIEAAYAAAEADLCASIGDLLGKDSKVPVYYGSP